jgi:hypothetical protein
MGHGILMDLALGGAFLLALLLARAVRNRFLTLLFLILLFSRLAEPPRGSKGRKGLKRALLVLLDIVPPTILDLIAPAVVLVMGG